jgi:UDP-glucose:glycoprotein glucosyltransferase
VVTHVTDGMQFHRTFDGHLVISVSQLLRPVYPGPFHTIKRNLHNTVLLLDLSQRASLTWITGPISTIIQRGFPFRFGVVPLVETEEGV